jgi:hypothetical protein
MNFIIKFTIYFRILFKLDILNFIWMQKNSKAIFDDSKMRPLSKNERKSE